MMQIIITTDTRGAEDLSARVNDWSFDTRAGVGFTTARVVLDAPERDLWYLLNAASTDTVEFRYAGVLVWQGYIAGAVRRGTRLEITADGAGMRLNDIEVWRVFCDSEVRNWLPDSELPSGFAADNNNRLYIGAGGTIARSTEGQVTYPDDEIVLGADIVKLRAHALVNVPFGPWIVEIRDDADAVLWTTTDSYDDDLELTVADAEGLVLALRATATVTTIPSQMQAALAGAGAGNLGEGSYGYVVVFVDAHGESAVSQEATLTVNDRTADGQAALSLIALGYSGTTARRLYRSKITPATLTAALAGLGAGTLLNGTYSYAVTFISAGGESSPSGIATVTVVDASTDGQVALTDIPRGPDGTTARRIYRTDADGSVLYLAATLSDNTTTTYTDNSPYSISTTPPDADEAYYLLATVADNTTTTYTDNTADDGLGAALAVDADRATYVRLTEVIVQTLDPATTSAIITALASDAGLDTDGVEESSLTVDRASWQGPGRGTAIREMADLGDGAVSWLLTVYENDALRLRAWPETATWLLHAAEGAVDIGYDRAAIFNAVRGHLPDGYLTDWQTDVDSITRWGRREKTLDLEQTSQAEAARLAAVYLADHAWPVTGLRIAAGEVIRTVDGSPWPVWRIRAGQVLTLRDVFPYRDVDIRIAETQARPGGVSIIPQGADNRLEVYLAAQERKLKRAAQTAETSVQQGSAVTGGTGGAVATGGDMLKSVYDPDGDGTVASADYATSSGDSAELGGVAAADYLTEAEHTAIGNGAPHHAPVTLDANADTLLSLSTQQVGLDTQAANLALAGPSSGAAAVPTFRALVSADLPAATEAAQGAVELATNAETQAGASTTLVVTPAGLRADVPTTPAASRGVRLDASGNLWLPEDGAIGITGDVRTVYDSSNGYINEQLGDNAGADEWRVLDSGGVAVATVDSDGNGYFAGNVGIGTTGPLQKFNVHGNYGNPATSGTTQNGIAAFSVADTYSTLYVGSASASPYAMWLQASGRNDLSVNYPIVIQPNGGNVGIGTTRPGCQLHIDQSSSTGAKPVLLLDQADQNYVLCKFIGYAAAASADRTFVAASDFTTPGALAGWIQVEIQDDGNRIADGDYYIPIYAAPTA